MQGINARTMTDVLTALPDTEFCSYDDLGAWHRSRLAIEIERIAGVERPVGTEPQDLRGRKRSDHIADDC